MHEGTQEHDAATGEAHRSDTHGSDGAGDGRTDRSSSATTGGTDRTRTDRPRVVEGLAHQVDVFRLAGADALAHLPAVGNLAKQAVSTVGDAFTSVLEQNRHSEDQVHDADASYREHLLRRLDSDELTPEEREDLMNRVERGIGRQAERDDRAKLFKSDMFKQAVGVAGGVVAVVGAVAVVAVTGGRGGGKL